MTPFVDYASGGILGLIVLRWGMELIRQRNGNGPNSVMQKLLGEAKRQNIQSRGMETYYFYFLVRNMVISKIRNDNRRFELVYTEEDIYDIEDEAEEEEEQIYGAVREVTDEMHFYYKGLLEIYSKHKSYRKVSRLTGIPLTSVANGVRRAKEIAIEQLNEKGITDSKRN